MDENERKKREEKAQQKKEVTKTKQDQKQQIYQKEQKEVAKDQKAKTEETRNQKEGKEGSSQDKRQDAKGKCANIMRKEGAIRQVKDMATNLVSSGKTGGENNPEIGDLTDQMKPKKREMVSGGDTGSRLKEWEINEWMTYY